MKVDLYISSSIGRMVLKEFSPRQFNCIYVNDPILVDMAQNYGYNLIPTDLGDIAISIHWQKIFSDSEIERYKHFLNLHPGLIPQSRGMFPVFWDVYKMLPTGATMHQITSELDIGPILLQEVTHYEPYETGGEVWEKVTASELNLLAKTLEIIESDADLTFFESTIEPGKIRTKKEFYELEQNPPIEKMSKDEILRLILALTHKSFDLPNWAIDFLKSTD